MKAYMFARVWRIACINKNSSILLIRAPQPEQWLKLNLVLKLNCFLLNIGVITYLRLSSKIVNKRCACQQIVGWKCRWARFIVELGNLNANRETYQYHCDILEMFVDVMICADFQRKLKIIREFCMLNRCWGIVCLSSDLWRCGWASVPVMWMCNRIDR